MTPRRLTSLIVTACVAAAAAAGAGHESPFYPSFYPQEIKIQRLAPPAAAAGFAKNALHAYVGADPFGAGAPPANVRAVESLAGWIVVAPNPTRVPAARRCATADAAVAALAGAGAAGFVFHPYPVTPFHGDYLDYADLAAAAKARYRPGAAGGVRLVARGPTAERLVATRAAGDEWDAAVEEVRLDDVLARARTDLNGWLGPSALKSGWLHAWLLSNAGGDADAAYRRLAAGAFTDDRERVTLERTLLTALTRRCERVVAGFVTRREYVDDDYSAGVENVGRDSQAGLVSHVFVRTVKLKDFPWNGWLDVGVASVPAAAWNPVGGFTDEAGRLVWAAVGDPAFLPAPGGDGWIPNRVTATSTTAADEVPADALAPSAGTGVLQPVGPGKRAKTRIVYRAVMSAFHDGSRMTVADLLYPYGFAARWGGRDGDPAVARATAGLRERLVAVRLVKVDTEVKNFGEDLKFTHEVPIVEAYLDGGGPTLAPPWSTVPWTVGALMEEAVRRGWAAFSAEEAKRRGVPWLDLVRDARLGERLAALAREYEANATVPPGLRGLVTPAEARERWQRLRAFQEARGHLLVTNGPYRLDAWSAAGVVLGVFRDLSYPLGVGAFDRYAIPLTAAVTRVVDRGTRLELTAAVDSVTRHARSFDIAREPLARADDAARVACRYVVVAPDGSAVAAGRGRFSDGRYVIELDRITAPGVYRVLIALAVDDNAVNAPITTVEHRVQP
jgi:hypothetical protein